MPCSLTVEYYVFRETTEVRYYTVSWGADTKNGKNVGNAYSEYIIPVFRRSTMKVPTFQIIPHTFRMVPISPKA